MSVSSSHMLASALISVLLVSTAAADAIMYGLSQQSALVSIDLKTGEMSALTPEHGEELEAQELSAIDTLRARYYSMGLNRSTGAVNLCVWSLRTGHKEQSVVLPFESSAFVGVGEVCPNESRILEFPGLECCQLK